jgi:nucleoid-associated protein YgaU
MDILTSKQTKSYDYITRYSSVYFNYNKQDKKYIYEISKQLDTTTSYVMHTIKQSDTLDSLADKYYGRPDLYWLIADFNRIQDPFICLFNNLKTIKIPSISTVKFLN